MLNQKIADTFKKNHPKQDMIVPKAGKQKTKLKKVCDPEKRVYRLLGTNSTSLHISKALKLGQKADNAIFSQNIKNLFFREFH